MITEEKIRKAADVASELTKTLPEYFSSPAWAKIFDAMLLVGNDVNPTRGETWFTPSQSDFNASTGT